MGSELEYQQEGAKIHRERNKFTKVDTVYCKYIVTRSGGLGGGEGRNRKS